MSWAELHNDYVRVSPQLSCPVCGKADGCLVHKTGKHVICYHVPSTKLWKIGFLHTMNVSQKDTIAKQVSGVVQQPIVKKPDFIHLHEMYLASISISRIKALAEQLGVSEQSLESCRIGWSVSRKLYTFPLCNAEYDIVGIQTRDNVGNKRLIAGSEVGLFIPNTFRERPGITFITEGVSDTAAGITLGLNTVGRFNDVSGDMFLADLLYDHTVFIIADNSHAEIHGAAALRDKLKPAVKRVSMVVLPSGDPKIKDLRMAVNVLGPSTTLHIILKQVQEQQHAS